MPRNKKINSLEDFIMSNFLKVLKQKNRKNFSISGIVISVAAVAGFGFLAYRKIKKIFQPRILCCRCITDEEIDALLMQSYEDENFYDDDRSEDDYE
jgi:hypothetical protein